MEKYQNEQLTKGELIKLIKHLPDDTKLYVGYGERTAPLRFLVEHNGGLMFHPDMYGLEAKTTNALTIIDLLTKNSR